MVSPGAVAPPLPAPTSDATEYETSSIGTY